MALAGTGLMASGRWVSRVGAGAGASASGYYPLPPIQAISCHYASSHCEYESIEGTSQDIVAKEVMDIVKRRFGQDTNFTFDVSSMSLSRHHDNHAMFLSDGMEIQRCLCERRQDQPLILYQYHTCLCQHNMLHPHDSRVGCHVLTQCVIVCVCVYIVILVSLSLVLYYATDLEVHMMYQ